MFVDDQSVQVDELAPTDENSAEAKAALGTTERRSRFARALALSLVALAGIGGLVVLGRRRSRRQWLARTALSAIDLRRRPPRRDTSSAGLIEALRALRRPSVPRVLPYVTLKRINPRVGDTFGHWWVEIDGTESYGWWPDRCPIRVRDFLFGSSGSVNGLRGSCAGGTAMTDPHHRESAQHSFHPTLTVRKSDRRVRADIRAFAQAFAGEWRYSTKPTSNDCRSFQVRLLNSVGLEEGPEHRHTRGQGCPFLALFRTRIRDFAT